MEDRAWASAPETGKEAAVNRGTSVSIYRDRRESGEKIGRRVISSPPASRTIFHGFPAVRRVDGNRSRIRMLKVSPIAKNCPCDDHEEPDHAQHRDFRDLPQLAHPNPPLRFEYAAGQKMRQ